MPPEGNESFKGLLEFGGGKDAGVENAKEKAENSLIKKGDHVIARMSDLCFLKHFRE